MLGPDYLEEPSEAGFLDSGSSVRRGLFALDIQHGKVLDVDHRIPQFTGHSADTLIGTDWSHWIHPDDQAGIMNVALQTLRQGVCRWVCRFKHADGSYVTYHCEACLGGDGTKAYSFMVNAADLVEQRRETWQYERLSELAKDLFVVADTTGAVVAVNHAAEKAHGLPREAMVGRPLADFVTAEGVEILGDIPRRFMTNGQQPVEFTIPALAGNGDVIIFECVTSFDDETQRWYTIERDVTERVERDRELEIGKRFFDLSGSQLVLLDSNGLVMRTNPAFCDFLGVEAEAAVGQNVCDLFGAGPSGQLAQAINTVRSRASVVEATCGAQTQRGMRTLAVELTPGTDGETIFFSSRDVTEEQRLEAELVDRASRDQLTRLANRDVFNDALRVTLQFGHTAGVLMLDLDDFKWINDGLGHAAGDELLCRVADRLERATRPDDLVARFGGDEFVVLLRGISAASDAQRAADSILAAMAEPFVLGGRPMHITASIGVTAGSMPDRDASRLLREADAAAYKAKRSGRNQSQMYDEKLELFIQTRREVEATLRDALRHRRMDVDVQGIYSIEGQLVAVEALARMIDANGLRSGPPVFLDVARQLGLLARMGEAVFDRTLGAMAPWLQANPDCDLSLNADQVEISAPTFLGMIEDTMSRHGVDPMQVTLEVTESGLLEPTSRASWALTELRKMGMRISIDDFGRGATSLGYLRDLRVDQVKIDRAFIKDITTNRVSHTIIRTIVMLANDLGIAVVAEGVEEQSQHDALVELGCPVMQGYLLHRPEPVDQFLASQP